MTSRSTFALAAAAMVLSLPVADTVQAQRAERTDLTAAQIEALARDIHDTAIAIDSHVDVPPSYASHAVDPGGFTDHQVDLPKMRIGGLDAAFFVVYSRQRSLTADAFAQAREDAEGRYHAIMRLVGAYPDQIGLAKTAKDIERIHASGRAVALIGMENAFPLGNSLADMGLWYERGVRYIGLTHFGHNQFGDSSNPIPGLGDGDTKHGGLSELGRAAVAEMNRLGIMLDVSHAHKTTMMQATALSAAPVIASHSSVMAVTENARNLDDEQLRAIAQNGGVAQITAFDTYIKELSPEKKIAQEAIRRSMGLETLLARFTMSEEQQVEHDAAIAKTHAISPRATVGEFIDHIDHAVAVAGVDHVGISSDFGGGGGVDGWDNAAETLNVTRELVRRGYSEHEIVKLWGGNLLRVMRQVETAARRIQRGR